LSALPNLHFSCYANASVQGLSACPPFRASVFQSDHEKDHTYEDEVEPHGSILKPANKCPIEAAKKAILHKDPKQEMTHLLQIMRNMSELNTKQLSKCMG
jgi:hypothetical protein